LPNHIFNIIKKDDFDLLKEIAKNELDKENYFDPIEKENRFIDRIKEQLDKIRQKSLESCKGTIIILGPNPNDSETGSLIRNYLKIKLNEYIESKCGLNSEIKAIFPEDIEGIDLSDESHLFYDSDIKLIYVIYSKEAKGVESEILKANEYPESARKLIIFIDKIIWDEGHFNVNKGEINYLKETFNTVYIVDFEQDFQKQDFIINTAKWIFNKHHTWASKHHGNWPNDHMSRI